MVRGLEDTIVDFIFGDFESVGFVGVVLEEVIFHVHHTAFCILPFY
jgi:hypothetical protein